MRDMSTHSRRVAAPPRRVGHRDDLLPALVSVLLAGLVVLLRPPLPIDETRYCQVFLESLTGNPLLLKLMQQPYPEKPPLLFWLARAGTWLGLDPLVALRLLPALAAGATVLVLARIGARARLELAGWVHCALLLPMLASQLLLFDTLLSCAIWAGVLAWLERRDGLATVAIAAALLTKGPVAFLFVVPLLWALAPLRDPGPRVLRRTSMVLGFGLLVLAAWAVGAALIGGPDFARLLLWDRWAGRIVQAADHRRPLWFYLPIVLGGALPGLFLIWRRPATPRAGPGSAEPIEDWARRARFASGLVLLVFSLISGKQAHYLVPAAPLLALLIARELERVPRATRRLRAGIAFQLSILAAGLVVLVARRENLLGSSGLRGREFLEQHGSWIPVLLGLLLVTVVVTARARNSRTLLASAALGCGATLLGLHGVAGRLLYPHALAEALRESPDAPVAYMGNSLQGLYPLLSEQRAFTKVADALEARAWVTSHPRGILLADLVDLQPEDLRGFEVLVRDRAHRHDLVALRLPLATATVPGNASGSGVEAASLDRCAVGGVPEAGTGPRDRGLEQTTF